MAIIQGNAVPKGASGFYPKTIDHSLRFEDGDQPRIERTPASSGSLTTWTLSWWVKPGNLGISRYMFSAYDTGASTYTLIRFHTDNTLHILKSTGYSMNLSRVFSDPSAWYHMVYVWDTTNATAEDRDRLYINGERITTFSSRTQPSLNENSDWNQGGIIQTIGNSRLNLTVNQMDGYMAEVHFTDGTAYEPTDFGELKSGIWVPKDVEVTYGTNGFYLPFSEDVTVEGFNTVTYKGTGSTRSVSGVGFTPDLVWVKRRDSTPSHNLFDSVRGAGKPLFSNLTNAEASDGRLTSFDSDGFSLDSDSAVNASGASQVAWCWDAGSGSPASNTDGSITSTVKANTAYGFSIVGYTGNDTSGSTIGHGLSQAPEMIIVKERSQTRDWTVYHKEIGNTGGLRLNTTSSAETTREGWWSNTDPSSSVITLGGNPQNDWYQTNQTGQTYIAYCFHSVSGYSDFGSYTGNGLADDSGPTVTTGFKPALVIYKQSSGTGNWSIVDNTRSPEPVAGNLLNPNLSNSENISDEWIKFTDTGFQVRNTHSDQNANGATYIYMAFADTRDAAFWLDQSGNNNDWTHNNLEHSDVVSDSPTNNFCTLNSVEFVDNSGYLSEGNLKISDTSSANLSASGGTIGMKSGKWY